MKFLDSVGPIAISLLVWSQYFAENKGKICHIVPSLWQTTVYILLLLIAKTAVIADKFWGHFVLLCYPPFRLKKSCFEATSGLK